MRKRGLASLYLCCTGFLRTSDKRCRTYQFHVSAFIKHWYLRTEMPEKQTKQTMIRLQTPGGRKSRMLFTLLLFMSFSSCFGQERGYAVFDDGTGTLSFQYGTPTGTLNTDYYNTDNTGTNTPGWYDKRTSIKKVVFDSSFAKARPRSCAYWFAGCANLTEIEDGNCLNTSA